MRMALKNLLLVIWMAVCTAGYAQNNTDNLNNKIAFSNPAKPIVVQKSSPTFIILLQSNPTTGYSWFLKGYNAKYIKVVTHKFIPPQRRMMGAPGYQQWVFAVTPVAFKQAVTTSIRLVYMRPWEKTKPAQDVTFKVIAK